MKVGTYHTRDDEPASGGEREFVGRVLRLTLPVQLFPGGSPRGVALCIRAYPSGQITVALGKYQEPEDRE